MRIRKFKFDEDVYSEREYVMANDRCCVIAEWQDYFGGTIKHMTSCDRTMFTNGYKYDGFNYCPYCGRKFEYLVVTI